MGKVHQAQRGSPRAAKEPEPRASSVSPRGPRIWLVRGIKRLGLWKWQTTLKGLECQGEASGLHPELGREPLGSLSRYSDVIRVGIWNAPSLEIDSTRQMLRGKSSLAGQGHGMNWALHTHPMELPSQNRSLPTTHRLWTKCPLLPVFVNNRFKIQSPPPSVHLCILHRDSH